MAKWRCKISAHLVNLRIDLRLVHGWPRTTCGLSRALLSVRAGGRLGALPQGGFCAMCLCAMAPRPVRRSLVTWGWEAAEGSNAMVVRWMHPLPTSPHRRRARAAPSAAALSRSLPRAAWAHALRIARHGVRLIGSTYAAGRRRRRRPAAVREPDQPQGCVARERALPWLPAG